MFKSNNLIWKPLCYSCKYFNLHTTVMNIEQSNQICTSDCVAKQLFALLFTFFKSYIHFKRKVGRSWPHYLKQGREHVQKESERRNRLGEGVVSIDKASTLFCFGLSHIFKPSFHPLNHPEIKPVSFVKHKQIYFDLFV